MRQPEGRATNDAILPHCGFIMEAVMERIALPGRMRGRKVNAILPHCGFIMEAIMERMALRGRILGRKVRMRLGPPGIAMTLPASQESSAVVTIFSGVAVGALAIVFSDLETA